MADRDEINWIELNEPWRLKEKENEVVITKWYEGLEKIKGIGKETAKDIGLTFRSEDELIQALVSDRVPLRNDKVQLLKAYFNLNSKGGK